MIQKIKLRNYRNFKDNEFIFSTNKNFILGNNWAWKTNILEALTLIYQKDSFKKSLKSLVNEDENNCFIEVENNEWKKFSVSIDKEKNVKNLLINWKKTSKAKFNDMLEKLIIFQPMDMNIMYLSPSLRRDFLDGILSNTFYVYKEILRNYKNIVKNRNKVLKNIKNNKSNKSEINFWDDLLINKAKEIYDYRIKLNNFLKENIDTLKSSINLKSSNIKYNYISKVNLENVEDSISSYLKENIDRDIILGNTYIWPHIDDFDIILNWYSLIDFASRGETKSIIMWLKIIETKFLKQITNKEIIFLIDDLFSELDIIHENSLLNEIWNKQVIITSINIDTTNKEDSNFIYL